MNLVEGLDWVVTDVASRLYYSTVVGATTSAPLSDVDTTIVSVR
jgi:hypothetical protein